MVLYSCGRQEDEILVFLIEKANFIFGEEGSYRMVIKGGVHHLLHLTHKKSTLRYSLLKFFINLRIFYQIIS